MCELRDVFDSGTVVLVDSMGIAGGRSSQGVTGPFAQLSDPKADSRPRVRTIAESEKRLEVREN